MVESSNKRKISNLSDKSDDEDEDDETNDDDFVEETKNNNKENIFKKICSENKATTKAPVAPKIPSVPNVPNAPKVNIPVPPKVIYFLIFQFFNFNF